MFPRTPWEKCSYILATSAEFELDLIRLRTRDGMATVRSRGKLRGLQPKLSDKQLIAPNSGHWRLLHQRIGRAVHGVTANGLPDPLAAKLQPCPDNSVNFPEASQSGRPLPKDLTV